MLREIGSVLVPLLLPSLLMLAWFGLGRSVAGAARWQQLPWLEAVAAGVGLAVVVLFGLAMLDRAPVGGRYAPPHVEDGRIVPGTVAPAPGDGR